MEFGSARRILEKIEDSGIDELKTDLFKAAVRYAGIRASWFLATPEERRDQDRTRSIAHDRFIDACNILSRNMKRMGEDNTWREDLGSDRKEIGDFACYLTAILGVRAR